MRCHCSSQSVSSNRMVPEREVGRYLLSTQRILSSLPPGLRKNACPEMVDITSSSAYIPSIHQEEVTHGMLSNRLWYLSSKEEKLEFQSSGCIMNSPSAAVSKTSFHVQYWVTGNSLVPGSPDCLLFIAGNNPPGIRTTGQRQ